MIRLLRRRAGRSSPGFTLLELLVAMTLVSLLSVMMLSGLRMGTRVWERSADVASDTDELRAVRGFLRTTIGRAYPVLKKDIVQGVSVLDFAGAPDELRFLAPMPQAVNAGGLARLSIRIQPGSNGQQIVAIWAPELPSDSSFNRSVVLLDGLASARFHYYGAAPGQPNGWSDSWAPTSVMPKLIQIQAAFTEGDRRSWQDLDVAPAISVSADCVYDPMTQGCAGR